MLNISMRLRSRVHTQSSALVHSAFLKCMQLSRLKTTSPFRMDNACKGKPRSGSFSDHKEGRRLGCGAVFESKAFRRERRNVACLSDLLDTARLFRRY